MIVFKIWQGLGNQLFQYAFARAYQIENGCNIAFDVGRDIEGVHCKGSSTYRKFGLQNFNVKLKLVKQNEIKKYYYIKNEGIYSKFILFLAERNLWPYSYYEQTKEQFGRTNFKFSSNCYVKGWFQNPYWADKYRNILIKEITPQKKIKINKKLEDIINDENTVSIHFRRGDYKKDGAILPDKYYMSAMKYFIQRNSKSAFLVFSDEISWIKNNFNFPTTVYFIDDFGKYMDYEELMIMSRCKNNIISNSTFSWWGAWLNRNDCKTVIAPKKWFYGQSLKMFDIVPSEWIKI